MAIEVCGAWPSWGGCVLPKGHNRGQADVPGNHAFPERRAGVRVRYTSPSGCTLQLGHDGDAGIDLPVAEAADIHPRCWANIPVDVCVEMPPGCWGLIIGRSSTHYRKHLLVNQAVIDNGYRGPLFVSVYNPGPILYTAEAGERLAQLILIRLVRVAYLDPVTVDEFSVETERGLDGFGSTG